MRIADEKIFVEMVRFSGTHRYLLGFFDTVEEAKSAGELEFEDRAGKYGYEIYEPHLYYNPKREVVEMILKVKSNYEKIS